MKSVDIGFAVIMMLAKRAQALPKAAGA